MEALLLLINKIFPYFIHKIYVFNPDERFDTTVYKFKTKLDPQSPILEIVNKKMITTMKSHELNLETLESKYGGKFNDLKDYWPPRCFTNATLTLDDENMLLQGIEPFCYNSDQVDEYKSILKLRRAKMTTN